VIEIRGQPFVITCGDALTQEDSPVAVHELLGRVMAVSRRGKQIKLEETQVASSLGFRWAVRHSEALAVWLLRWHSLCARLAQYPGAAHSNFPKNFAEYT
jgi:hypothetical protein